MKSVNSLLLAISITETIVYNVPILVQGLQTKL